MNLGNKMQKLINGLAILSFLGTASIIGAGAYVYVQREAIADNIKSQIMEGVAGAIGEQLGDLGNLGGLGGGGGLPGASGGSDLGVPGLGF